MAHIEEIDVTGPVTLDRICGGEVNQGILYLSQDVEGDHQKNVLCIDTYNGNADLLFTRDCGKSDCTAGDITVYYKADGSMFHVSDYNGIIGVYLRSYTVI